MVSNTACRFLTMFLVTMLGTTCGGGSEPYIGGDQGEVDISGYFPYISSIRLPSEIYAGELFNFTIVVEMPNAEQVLFRQPERGLDVVSREYYNQSTMEYAWIKDVILREHGSGKSRNEFLAEARMRVPGDHSILILSTPTPELGGMPGKYRLTPSSYPLTEGLIYREFPVTVLPAREL